MASESVPTAAPKPNAAIAARLEGYPGVCLGGMKRRQHLHDDGVKKIESFCRQELPVNPKLGTAECLHQTYNKLTV